MLHVSCCLFCLFNAVQFICIEFVIVMVMYMGFVLGRYTVLVDIEDEGCHFDQMMKDAVLLDYDPDSQEIPPTCRSCNEEGCSYHQLNYDTVMNYERTAA